MSREITVILLGAGASQAEVLRPANRILQKELLGSYFAIRNREFANPAAGADLEMYESIDAQEAYREAEERMGHEISNHLSADTITRARHDSLVSRHIRLTKFLKIFFDIDADQLSPAEWDDEWENDDAPLHFPTFEETLGIIETAIEREEYFRGYGSPWGLTEYQRIQIPESIARETNLLEEVEESLVQIHEDFLYAITEVLSKKLENSEGYHKALIERLRCQNKLEETVFVSLNYDILIDNALLEKNLKPDYNISFTRGYPKKGRKIPLFKLHGSLNWLYCPRCVEVEYTKMTKGAAGLLSNDKKCANCGQTMVPMLIPPTFLKQLKNPYLQQIWQRADTVLRNCRRIIFCGYSLPEADLPLRYLLKRIQINRKIEDYPLDIYVVNKSNGVSDWTKEQYLRFFGQIQIHYLDDMNFQTFAKRGIDFSKNE